MSQDTSINWATLLLNPGQESKENSGLDARLLGSMLRGGQVPVGVLTETITLPVDEIPLPGAMRHTIRDRAGKGLGGPGSGTLTLPVWAAWVLLRSRSGPERQVDAVELLHGLGIVPWNERLFLDLGVDVRGFDLLADVRDRSYQYDGDEAKVFQAALGALPQADREDLNNRARGEHLQGWEVSARTAIHPKTVETLANGGISGLDCLGDPYLSTGWNRNEVMEAKIKAGANPNLARRHILTTTDTVDARVKCMEHISREVAGDGEYDRTYADHIVNTLAAGSMSIAKGVDIIERAGETNGWPVHSSGQGIGYTLLAMAAGHLGANEKGVVKKLVQSIEVLMNSKRWWKDGADKEAAGLEGCGVSEWQCVKLARLLDYEHFEKGWRPGEFVDVLNGLSKQHEISISPSSIAYNCGEKETIWTAWARSPNGKDNTLRQAVACSQDDTWQLERFYQGQAEHQGGLRLLDGTTTLGRALVAKHALDQVEGGEDEDAIALWRKTRFTTWALAIIHGAGCGASRFQGNSVDKALLAEVIDPSFLESGAYTEQIKELQDFLSSPTLKDEHGDEERHSIWGLVSKHEKEQGPGALAKSAMLRATLFMSGAPQERAPHAGPRM